MAYVSVRGVQHYVEWVSDRSSEDCLSATDAPVASADLRQPNPDKPVMVFIHGWGGSCRYWRHTAQQMADRYDCLLYDLRGFGRSRLPRPIPPAVEALGYALEGYADDLDELLTILGIETVSLNAHSAGASIAAFFLNQYPQRTQQAILTCHGIFDYNALTFKLFHFVGQYVVAFRPAWFARIPLADRMFVARFLHRPIPPQDRQEFLEDFLMADYEAALGTLYTSVSKWAAEVMPEAYRSLTVPTLLLSGEYDQIIPVRLGVKAAVLSEQVQHVVLPNTGHFPMLEDNHTYQATINHFLQETPLSAVS
ncbi:MAG: alpha/beta hydrolase [Leptolyngbyaceae bacterium]|nr:alpha/beta hydrolase [Leptolyngbyaceae bacterium]